jgi:3-oxoacyl-[acyl-carrier protein] reductase
MDLGLDARVYVVTGGSGGLGLATAEALVADGAKVVVSSRHSDGVDAAVDALGGPEHATGVTADNADPETPGRLVEAARSAYGRLDGALVSVGGPKGGNVLDTPEEDWSAAFESLLLGGLRLGREIGRELAAQPDGGSIAFVLSTSVKSPVAGLAISNGLRPGLAMVAKDLADELGPRGVRVNGLMPGRVDTERVRWLDEQSGDAAAARERTSATIALRRYGTPEEFGRVAAFLLSPAAGFITGVMLPVDGGMLRSL